jgi:hypothetical protein
MNTLRYSLLVKDKDVRKRIDRLQRVNTCAALALFPICLMYLIVTSTLFSPEGESAGRLAAMWIYVAVCLTEIGFSVFFHAYVSRRRKTQVLRPDLDPADTPFAALNGKYGRYIKRYMVFAAVTAGVAFALAVGLTVPAALGAFDWAWVSGASASVFLVYVVAVPLAGAVMQIRFASGASAEINALADRFAAEDGLTPEQAAKRKRRAAFFNVAGSQKMLAYLFPDAKLRAMHYKTVFFLIAPCVVGGLMLGTGAAVSLFSEAVSIVLMVIGLTVAVGGCVGAVVWQLKLRERQYKLLQAEPEKYELHLKLRRENKKMNKWLNI